MPAAPVAKETKHDYEVVITKDNFEEEITNYPGVVLVDFWAAWCGPCRAMAPRIENIAHKYAENGQVKVAKIDVDAELELSQEHQVLSIPTFKVFAAGKFIDQRIGLIPEGELDKLVENGLSHLAA